MSLSRQTVRRTFFSPEKTYHACALLFTSFKDCFNFFQDTAVDVDEEAEEDGEEEATSEEESGEEEEKESSEEETESESEEESEEDETLSKEEREFLRAEGRIKVFAAYILVLNHVIFIIVQQTLQIL